MIYSIEVSFNPVTERFLELISPVQTKNIAQVQFYMMSYAFYCTFNYYLQITLIVDKQTKISEKNLVWTKIL